MSLSFAANLIFLSGALLANKAPCFGCLLHYVYLACIFKPAFLTFFEVLRTLNGIFTTLRHFLFVSNYPITITITKVEVVWSALIYSCQVSRNDSDLTTGITKWSLSWLAVFFFRFLLLCPGIQPGCYCGKLLLLCVVNICACLISNQFTPKQGRGEATSEINPISYVNDTVTIVNGIKVCDHLAFSYYLSFPWLIGPLPICAYFCSGVLNKVAFWHFVLHLVLLLHVSQLKFSW